MVTYRTPYKSSEIIASATVNASGVIYLFGQIFLLDEGAKLTLNTGSIISHQLLPEGGSTLNLTGQSGTATVAEIAMRKTVTTGGKPTIVR